MFTDIIADGAGSLVLAGRKQVARFSLTDFTLTHLSVSGSGQIGSADGTADTAHLSSQFSLTINPAGGFVMADAGNNTIRRIGANGTITTIAGLPFDNTITTRDGHRFGHAASHERRRWQRRAFVVVSAFARHACRIPSAPDLHSPGGLIWSPGMLSRPRQASLARPFLPSTAFGRILGWVLLVLCGVALAGTIVLQVEKQPEESPVGRGEKLAHQAGCFACHGRGDGEPRFNLRQANDKWAGKANPTFWENGITESKVIVDWITNGVPADQVAKHKKLFIQMPAYKDRLKPDEIDAIAAWILAEGLKLNQTSSAKETVTLPKGPLDSDQLFAAGDHLSRKYGCYQCHGELGQGGIANSGSFKGYIPGLFGRDLAKLTANLDRNEILYWIDHGRGRAVETGLLGGLAKKYLDGQATQMPGYRDQLTVEEKGLLADYILLLNKKGPLPAKEIERLTALLEPN